MRIVVAILLVCGGAPASAQPVVRLPDRTNQAFDRYIEAAEAGMTWQARPGGIAPWDGKSPIKVDDGLIHDWASSIFVPGATVEKALAVFQDYPNYSKIFAPEILNSELISHQGDIWRARLRIQRKKVLTVVLDGEFEIEYRPLSAGRWAILSRSRRMTEIRDGKPMPEGENHGFLWRLNAYWLLAPREGGLELDCRSISLSRTIPAGLGWLVGPFVSSVPRESLRDTLAAVARALR